LPPYAHAAAETSPADAGILALLAGGRQREAFDSVVAQHAPSIYRLCVTLLRDPAQADDVAQDALIRIWKALPDYDGRAALSTWIYAITRNRCLTAISARRDHASLSEPDVAAAAEAALPVAAADESPAELLRELVAALPERYRQAVTLYYFEDRSVPEVAAMLGIPEGTVKTNLFRAREALLARLGALGLKDISLWLSTTT
jgi:RNA polymerase sigma-70 factor (ECF subfamily)